MQDESQRKTVEMDNFYRALASMRVVFDLFAPVAQSYAEQLFDKTCRGKGAPPPFDVVAKFHRYNITRCNKANTKRAHWCDPARGPWELAKFLIRDDIREGREKTRASETDISQIVNFLQYCKLVEWPNCRHHLAELQTRRNRLLHLGSQRLKEADYKQTIDTLTTTVKSLTLAEFKPRVAETLDKLKQATQRTFFSLQDREELVLNESPFLQDLQPLLPRKRYCCPSPELFECVRNTLTSNTPVKRNVLLWGMSAVGKSSLASAVVADQSVRDKFSNRIRWVSLKPPTSVVEPNFRPARLLHKLARSVGAPKADDDQDSIKHSAFYLKKYLSDRPILIVVDGAWDAALISPLVAIGPHCRILVTSTLRLTLPAKSFTTLTLTPPDAKHAREIFLRALAVDKNDIDDDDGDEIDGFRHSHAHSHLCQPPPECVEKILSVMSSPLSLSMLGKQLRHAPREDWEEAVRRLCDTDSPPSEKVDEGRLFPLIQQCLDSMQPNNAQLCGTIRECYLALGVFPKATPIPLSLLSTLWSDENQTLSVGHTIVANLERASLATCDATSLYLYQLHHDYAASECRKAGRIVEWHNRIANAYRAQYEKCTVNCWSPDDYFADHLVYHLIHGEQSAVAFDLLCSFDWIHFRICVGGTGSLFGPIDDCDRLLDLPKSSLDDTQHAHVALLRRTLRLMVGVEWSSPENPQELALQLYGRLQTRSTANQHTQRLCRELYAALNHASLPLSILPACESDPFLETADGAVDAVLRGHDAIRVIAVVPGGRYALSGGDDANVCVWDLAHFSLMGTLKGHESPVTALTAPAHTDGTPLRVMSGDKDGFIRVWDATLCTTLFTLRVYRSREVSALAVSSTGHQLASGCAGAIELWNLCDDVSPDGSISTDDESDRRRIHMLGESSTTRVLLVRWLAYTHGDARLLSGGSFDTLSEKADERVAVREWCLDMVPSGMNFQMHLEPYSVILAVAVAEQVVLPSGLQGVLVAATDDKGELHAVNERPLVLSQDHTHISAMTLTPNGQCVVCGIQNELLVLKRSTSSAAFAPVATLYGHSDIVTGCAAINNDCVLSCSLDSTLRVWSLHRQPHLQRPRVEALAIMEYPGMYRILLSKSDGCGEILCYAPTSDAASQPTTLRPRSHFECVTCIVVAGESHSFASCDMQGNICLWKAVLSAENFTPFKNFKVPRDTDCLALSPLGEYLVWAVEKDVRVCRVDEPPTSVPAVRAWHNKSVSALSVALASDRTTNRIFTAYKGKQGTVVVWSVSLAEPECVFKLGSRIDSVATTLSGEYVVFGCDKVAHVYRYAETVGASTAAEAMLSESYQFVPQRRLEGHTKSLTRIAVVSEKRKGTVRALTGSDDNTVRVWDALTGEQLALVPVHGQARLLSFSTSLLVVAPERGFFPFAVGCPVKALRDWDDDDDVFDDCANFSPVTPVPASLGDTPSRRSSSTFVDMVRSRRSSTTSNFSEST